MGLAIADAAEPARDDRLRVRIDADSVRNEEIDCHLGTIAGPALRPVSREAGPTIVNDRPA
jgi:hypothetical protein